ncbi:MAG: hypothetical protein GY774_09030 [Planctomycetes bacterium]|nr:hypothetical protein [Planctomycetota bacterium]
MAYDYSRLSATAVRLVAKFGRDVDLVSYRNQGASYDPSRLESTETVKAVQVQLDNIDENLIKSTDKGFLIAAAEVTVDMSIRDGSKDYSIVAITEVTPGDTVMIYKVQARR